MTEAARPLPLSGRDLTSTKPKRPRKYLKCQRCRDDRKGCDFNAGSSVCIRCTDLGHSCSGALRAERIPKRKAGALVDKMNRTVEGSIDGSTMATGSTSASDQVVPRRNPNHARISYGIALNVAAQRLYARMRADLEHSLKFEDVSGMLSTFERSQTLLGHIFRQSQSLQGHLMTSNNVHHPHLGSSGSDLQERVPIIVDPVSEEFVVVLCTANILRRYQSIGTQVSDYAHNMNKELPRHYYVNTAKAINQLVRSIPQDISEEWVAYSQHTRSARRPDFFPAWTIAWLNLDFENSQRLWSETVGREGLVVDVLGRNFPHLVAESGDPRPMNLIHQIFLADAGRDGRGLNLVDLAVVGDSASMITRIIDEHLVPPPHTRAMQRAITGKRLSLARDHLLDRLFETDEIELKMLANLAYRNGLIELSDALKEMEPYQATQEDTLAALDESVSSFLIQYNLESNVLCHSWFSGQYWPPSSGSLDSWDEFDHHDDAQFQPSRDPGGGSYRHRYDALFSPS